MAGSILLTRDSKAGEKRDVPQSSGQRSASHSQRALLGWEEQRLEEGPESKSLSLILEAGVPIAGETESPRDPDFLETCFSHTV